MIYLDNAATSWPKAPNVHATLAKVLDSPLGNIGRSSHTADQASSSHLYRWRKSVERLIPFTPTEKIIFTHGATESLNIALQGSLVGGEHLLTTPLEHNSVARPLTALKKRGVTFDLCHCDKWGRVELESLEKQLKSTKYDLVVITAASNVSGALNPLIEIDNLCSLYQIPLVVDASQVAGEAPMAPIANGALCFSLHKGVLGPQGVGVLALYGEFSPAPLLFGGTGSSSDSDIQPPFLPDKYESGTLPIALIVSSEVALHYVVDNWKIINSKRESLTTMLYEGLSDIESLRILTPPDKRVTLISVTTKEGMITPLEQTLYNNEIAIRGGFHCSPWAHRFFNTVEQGGAVRFSVGLSTTQEEIATVLKVIREGV